MKSIFMKLFIIGLCVSFFPTQAIAGGQLGPFTINWVNQRECGPSKGFEVNFGIDHPNPDGCSNPRTLELECDEKWYLPSLAVFLTAFSQNMPVDVFVQGCDSEGHALVQAVQMIYEP